MVHMVVLDMAEAGTEADAISRLNYDIPSAKIKPICVKIEGQFLYFILDPASEFIRFMGKVVNSLEN